MKTVLFHRHGGPDVLEYTDFPAPEPGPGMVLVRLRAAALNRMDVMVRNGWPGLKLELPHINGADGAGEVTALGEGVEGFETGVVSYGSDAPELYNLGERLLYGPGSILDAHTDNENIKITDMNRAVDDLTQIYKKLKEKLN